MDKQAKTIADFKRDLPAILAGNDPLPDRCARCGMTFSKTSHQGGEVTICAECGRWFAHGYNAEHDAWVSAL